MNTREALIRRSESEKRVDALAEGFRFIHTDVPMNKRLPRAPRPIPSDANDKPDFVLEACRRYSLMKSTSLSRIKYFGDSIF